MIKKLSKIPLFSELTKNDLNIILEISTISYVKKNKIIFYQGDDSSFLNILVEGEAEIYKYDNKKNKILIHYLKTPNLLAERANLENIPYPANCKMVTDGIILKIEFKKFKNIFNNTNMCFKITKSLLSKMNQLENIIENNLLLDIPTRIAKFIYENPNQFLNLKQHQIANLLNIKPETLSRKLKLFKELGIIENKNSKLIIKNKEKLKEFFN